MTTSSHRTAEKWRHPNHGRLLVPGCWDRAADTAYDGIPWAADNGCYRGLDREAFQRMIYGIAALPGCLFVVAPDVFDPVAGVGDHDATLESWHEWHPLLAMTGHPLAFVLQNGSTPENVPWDDLDAVFIGGCTAWKLGAIAESIVAEAKRRGKHVHMGRVNTLRRIRYALSIGVDSIDGTKWAKFRDTYMSGGLNAVSAGQQLRMETA